MAPQIAELAPSEDDVQSSLRRFDTTDLPVQYALLFCLVVGAICAPQQRESRQVLLNQQGAPILQQPQLIQDGAYLRPQIVQNIGPRRIALRYPQQLQGYTFAPGNALTYQPRIQVAAPQVYRQPLISGAAPRTAAILRQAQDVSFDGTYSYGFDSEDGISVQASAGPLTAVGPEETVQTVTGTYSYVAPDGTPITTNWIADENGFRAEGAHLPKAPEGSVRIV